MSPSVSSGVLGVVVWRREVGGVVGDVCEWRGGVGFVVRDEAGVVVGVGDAGVWGVVSEVGGGGGLVVCEVGFDVEVPAGVEFVEVEVDAGGVVVSEVVSVGAGMVVVEVPVG